MPVIILPGQRFRGPWMRRYFRSIAAENGLKGECYSDVNEALAAARTNASVSDLIFVGGSTFIVAEVI